jgi:hypothetical protein
MFVLAIFVGIYSYLIFFLGIFGLLTKVNVWLITIIWLCALFLVQRKTFAVLQKKLKNLKLINLNSNGNWFFYLLFTLLLVQAFVNLIGALGPELAFDALWYHLTLPKLYLLHHAIIHIPGGLLYYSDMPKLGEMLYAGVLSFGNEIGAKLIHFVFGILIVVVLYKLSRKFFNQTISLLIVVIFYSNLVVDWESITAYIDLIRTFFEVLTLWGLINWYQSQKNKWLVVSGVMMGLAITTKVLAIGSFFILLALLVIISLSKRNSLKDLLVSVSTFSFFSILIPLPWLIFSFINTGNPFYPFFTALYGITANPANPFLILSDLWNLFIHSADPISPIYLIFLPLLFVFYTKMRKEIKIIIWYCALSLLLWYFTPRTGGGRFILPYLPAFSLVSGALFSEILKKTRIEWNYTSKFLLSIIVLVSIISISYRGLANAKYIPVIIGIESSNVFLSNHLNFAYGDFVDIDNYFAYHIKSSDTVLLNGFHNLYYVDFPFIDSTWVKRGDGFDYVATQNTKLPIRFANWHLIYSNDKTMVKLYKPPPGVCNKICYY